MLYSVSVLLACGWLVSSEHTELYEQLAIMAGQRLHVGACFSMQRCGWSGI
jgi:hypothetical protein